MGHCELLRKKYYGKNRIRKKSQKCLKNIPNTLTLKTTSVPFLNTDEG